MKLKGHILTYLQERPENYIAKMDIQRELMEHFSFDYISRELRHLEEEDRGKEEDQRRLKVKYLGKKKHAHYALFPSKYEIYNKNHI